MQGEVWRFDRYVEERRRCAWLPPDSLPPGVLRSGIVSGRWGARPRRLTEMSRSFYIRTFGCQMNEHDSEQIAGLLVAEGMHPVDDAEIADVVVLNTCCIRENADNRLYGTLGHLRSLKERRPGLQIAVAGCLAQKDRGQIMVRADHVDVVFGTHNISRAPALLEAARFGPVVEILEEHEADPLALPTQRKSGHSAWITIQIGCDNSCTFCIVPTVRGAEISRRMGDIVHEAEQMAAEGVREITLLGQNVNSYGRDLGAGQYKPQFADLLRAIDAVDGISRIRYISPHPKDLRPETIAAMAECDSVCEHIHLPLQSGSDSVLARMHRGYRAERYLTRLADARAAIPDLAVTTDLIVGFPGETDAEFAATLAVVDEADFDAAYTFVFSPRPGTPAAEMVDDFVAPEVVRDRMAQLTEVVERNGTARHKARMAKVEEILVEGPDKRSARAAAPDAPVRVSGRTRQGKMAHVTADLAAGTIATVRITETAPHWLAGELVEVVAPAPVVVAAPAPVVVAASAPPPTRVLIPVVAG